MIELNYIDPESFEPTNYQLDMSDSIVDKIKNAFVEEGFNVIDVMGNKDMNSIILLITSHRNPGNPVGKKYKVTIQTKDFYNECRTI